MRKYFLNTRKKTGRAKLFTRLRRRSTSSDILVNTLVEVDINDWTKRERDWRAEREYSESTEGKKVFRQLEEVDKVLDEYFKGPDRPFDKNELDAMIADLYNQSAKREESMKEKQERLEREEQERLEAMKEAERKANVLNFMDYFLNGIKSGEIKADSSQSYAKNTCKVWSNFYGILYRFYKINKFTWTEINKALADRFVLFMENEGYMVKSINKYIICFRAMVGYAMEHGWHDNAKALTAFSKKKVQEEDKAKEIYLTSEELQALYEMPLDGLKGIVRDTFLIGCYTCQRFSDYSRIEKENFTTTSKGTKIVRLVQQKTKNSVDIPVLNDNLLRIAERYDYDIPRVNDVVLNRYIKEILKELSASVPSLAIMERTVLTMKERAKEAKGETVFQRDRKGNVVKPRYDLVSSHTARRSGITNLYKTGLFDTVQMMSVSGHKDEGTFMEYIKLSSEEIADAIAKKLEERKKNMASNEGLF